jgi:predicted short-subunit dehydrogenase-like oxidoreductase (DUF2520 family)
MSLAVAASAAGHDVVGVVGRTQESATRGAALVDSTPLTIGDVLPAAELLLITTRDDVIGAVATALVDKVSDIGTAVHVSGLTSVVVLEPLQAAGLRVGSFHPLQTLPTPEAGAARLAGAFIAVTAEPPLRGTLNDLATDLGATPFQLSDEAKPVYHAAAAAAANFPLVALAMAEDLFGEAGVPWVAARPLVEAVVANAFDLGPRAALTGPVARGDSKTVAAQLRAVDAVLPQWRPAFARFVEALAKLTGRSEQFEAVLNNEEET